MYPCLVKEVKLSVNIIFQLCIPAADDKNTDKALMLLRKYGASKLPSALLRFTDTNMWYSKTCHLEYFSMFVMFGTLFGIKHVSSLVNRLHTHMMAFGRAHMCKKKKQEERNLRGPNEGDLYATDAITYHIPDERLWMRSKIVFKFGQVVGVVGGVGGAAW